MINHIGSIFLLLLFTIIASSTEINNCVYINGDTKAVKVFCYLPSASDCCQNLFKNDSKAIHRSKVRILQLPSVSSEGFCNLNIEPFFGIFSNIRVLDYSFSRMKRLHPELKFNYLKIFNASHNELIFLSKKIFEHQPNLEQIDFCFNSIGEIDDDTFIKNTKLEIIILSHNALSSVNKNVFSYLKNLKFLDLNFNQIEWIDVDAFWSNKKLEVLRLANNPWNRFDCNMFASLPSLNIIEATLDDIEELDLSCAGSSFNVTESEVMIRLPLVRNELKCHKLQLKQLHRFSIAGHQLQNVTDVLALLGSPLRNLDLSSNYVNELNSTTFEQFENLKHLNLSRTNVTTLSDDAFKHNKLIALDISYDDLQNVNFSSLSKTLNNLESFSIAGARVRNISELLLLLSSSLQSLDISSNFVGKLNSSTFQRFNNLRILNLSSTELSNFNFGTFYHLTQLEMLDISHNKLISIDFTIFLRKFNHLRVLNLEGNELDNLKVLYSITKSRFPELVLLGLSKNRFTCNYLVDFVDKWPKLEFIHNPSVDGPQIDGVDCSY